MKKEVTIKDIAQKLGIHHTTVSRALQGSPKIKDETRYKIQQEAIRLGYTPNFLAQNFRAGRSRIISFVIPDFKHHFFSNLISCVTKIAHEKGFMIMLFQSNDNPEVEQGIINSLIGLKVSGVAVSLGLKTREISIFDRLKEEGIPLVFFDRVPQNTQYSTVSLANYEGMCKIVHSLVDKGRKRIAYISFEGNSLIFHERLNGYYDSLLHAGLSYQCCINVEQIFIEDGYLAALQLFEKYEAPDAVICINDEVALGVIGYLKERSINIPETVSVVGFDDNPMGSVCNPKLTTLSHSVEDFSLAVFSLLLKQQEENFFIKEDVVIPVTLKQRET